MPSLGSELEPGASFVRWLFQDPAARQRILNWSDPAAAAVGGLRYETGRRPHDRKHLSCGVTRGISRGTGIG